MTSLNDPRVYIYVLQMSEHFQVEISFDLNDYKFESETPIIINSGPP